ncbi:MAG: choice-of-anchor I family protein [Geminicoccaceae bacterium]
MPGGPDTGNLPTTQVVSSAVSTLSTGNALPDVTIIGDGGRAIPTEVIDDDGNTTFDPETDGLDFFESLEGMLVGVEEAVAAGPTTRFGEIPVLADNGGNSTDRTINGGVPLTEDNANPERIIVDDALVDNPPEVTTGDMFDAPVEGVLDYSFGEFKLLNAEPLPSVTPGGTTAETTSLAGTDDQLTVATYNVLNLDPIDDGSSNPARDDQLSRIGFDIVEDLGSPDIIALQEVQDENGTLDDGTVSGDGTFQALIDAIAASGGPTYAITQIDPVDGADGGVPGGNIRVGYLYNPERVSFGEVPGADASTPKAVAPGEDGPELQFNPGRVDPNDPAFIENDFTGFDGTRRSLATQFDFQGEIVFIVNNHFKSKSGDDPLSGETQPPVQETLNQRTEQAEVVRNFVEEILEIDPDANVIVLGDLNDFQFSEPVRVLSEGPFVNLIDRVSAGDAYTFLFNGNSQALDHVIVSPELTNRAEVDVVHINADFPEGERGSDHDPIVARFSFDGPDLALTGTFAHGLTEQVEGAAEISTFDPGSARIFVTNGAEDTIDVLDASDPSALSRPFQIDISSFGGGVNSVDAFDGLLAAAIENEDGNLPGSVVFFDVDGNFLAEAQVGVLPDMVTFTNDGTRVLTANEGEPTDEGDPLGSVSIVDVSSTLAGTPNVTTIDFTELDGQEDALREDGARIFPDKSASEDLEPEFIALSGDDSTAFVSLQENNAIAKIDLSTNSLSGVFGLGAKDHSVEGNGLDPSDRDGGINIANFPVSGLYQPDAIATFEVGGTTYIVTANEGDSRDEDERIEDLVLDPTAFPDADELQAEESLGRLEASTIDGDTDGDGDFDQLFAFGARSMSIWDEDGNLISDTGDQFAQTVAAQLPVGFNANGNNGSTDTRSDNSGVEPEGVVVGEVGGTPYAFVGLERVGGVMMVDISDPEAPEVVRYINNRDFRESVDGTLEQGDVGSEGLVFVSAEDSPNGAPLLVVSNEISGTTSVFEIEPGTESLPPVASAPPNAPLTLQLLHASDLEGGVDAIADAPNFAAVVDALEEEFDNTVILSAGDNFLSGPFFNAAGSDLLREPLQTFYQGLFDEPGLDNIREGGGRIDISIMNAIGFDASAIGNHEFDLGETAFEDVIATDIRGDALGDVRWLGAQFPYLSSNLDFSSSDLGSVFTDEVLSNDQFASMPDDLAAAGEAPKIAPATIIEEAGQFIGVVGATTPLLAQISSPGAVDIEEPGAGTNEMADLASILQPQIDRLTEAGVNKIILISHLQQIALETELAGLLDGVDIIVAGGSDTLLADGDDRLRAGDVAADDYPVQVTDASGNPVLITSTAGEYSYVGRLVVDFDENGIIDTSSLDPSVNGAFATDDQGVADLYGSVDEALDQSESAAAIQALTGAVSDIVLASDGNVFGETVVFLEGRREQVRTEETNIGNLTADANLAAAKLIDPSVVVSIKNGGGIRAPIGEIDGITGDLLPPSANPAAGKEEGEVSQLDIENALRFNNGLSLLTLTAEQLAEVLERSVAASGPGNTPGQFPQIAGVSFSFDADLPEGDRIQSAALLDDTGTVADVLIENGDLIGDAAREIRIVTLNFLADGGDDYPYPDFVAENAARVDRVDLVDDTAPVTGAAQFAPDGSEQDALAEFLAATFPVDGGMPFDVAETPPSDDLRIQNLDFRNDTVLDGIGASSAALASEAVIDNGDDLFKGGSASETDQNPMAAEAIVGAPEMSVPSLVPESEDLATS